MKQYNYIYLITNKINGKIYIGKHSTDNLNDGYMGSGLIIKRAIAKDGKDNFTKEYLAFCDSEDTLNYLEKFYIKKLYGSTDLFECDDDSIEFNDLSILTTPINKCKNII